MQRRALLKLVAVGVLGGVAGCGGDDDGGDPTTETTTDEGSSGDGSPIDASADALQLAVATLPSEEEWEIEEEEGNTIRFERTVQTTDYVIEASVLETESVAAAESTYAEQQEQANAYAGVETQDVDLASAAFGYKLTTTTGTVVFRDVNVVGKLMYGLAQHEVGRGEETALDEVVEYARLWRESWR